MKRELAKQQTPESKAGIPDVWQLQAQRSLGCPRDLAVLPSRFVVHDYSTHFDTGGFAALDLHFLFITETVDFAGRLAFAQFFTSTGQRMNTCVSAIPHAGQQ